MDNYEKLGKEYSKTHEKPDKKFVMLPTALKIVKPLKDKIVIDVGCGDGFFTEEFAKKAKFVYGIDKAKNQINQAKNNLSKNTKYLVADMNKYDYPKSDLIFAPFVLNYLKDNQGLKKLFKEFYSSLNKGGKVSGIIDTPKSNVHNMKQLGIIKKIKYFKQGEKIEINLYKDNKKVVTLHSYYQPPKIIEEILKEVGFKKIKWHKPFISKQGIKEKGKDFWKGYIKNCDLGYFSAMK